MPLSPAADAPVTAAILILEKATSYTATGASESSENVGVRASILT